MKFLQAYLRNLFWMAIIVIGMLIFAKIFYPGVLPFLPLMGEVYSGLNMWPAIILVLLVMALPRRKR